MPRSSREPLPKKRAELPDSWLTVKSFEPEGDDELAGIALALIKLLKFLNSKHLLRNSGKQKLKIRSRSQAKRLGLFRHDVTARGARFLDHCGSDWLADRIIFESIGPPSIGNPFQLVDQWEIWTNEKDEKFKKQFRRLLKGSDDFDLCDHVALMLDSSPHLFAALETRRDELNIVRFAWGAMGIIDNGGFEYLFQGNYAEDPDLTRTRHAFEKIGCKPAAKAFERAFSCFNDGKPPKNSEKRCRDFEKVPSRTRTSINQLFWKAGRDRLIPKLLAAFIREHPEIFEVEGPRPLMNQP